MIRTRLLAALAPLSLAACTAHGAPVVDQGPASPPMPSGDCNHDRLERFVNALPTSQTLNQIKRASGAHTIRVVRPGDIVTLEYRSDRLTIDVGQDGRIKRLRCG